MRHTQSASRRAPATSALSAGFGMFLLLTSVSAVAQTRPPAGALGDLISVTDGRSRRVSSAAPEAWSNRDNLWVPPGETRTLADIPGPAVINHIWLTFSEARPNWLAREGAANPSEIVLRMYWDDAPEPAVEAPLGDFFAAGFGRRMEVNSVPVQVQEGDAYNCFWPMPFHRRGRITITNESEKPLAALYYHIDYVDYRSKEHDSATRPGDAGAAGGISPGVGAAVGAGSSSPLGPDTPYFCAQYRQEFPEQLGRDYLIADIEGRGHYVGTVMSARARSPEWFGEGDDKFYVDGEERPSIWGTGTEDYFLHAWGLSKSSLPYFGVPYLEGQWGDVGWKICAYRWHIADPVRFQKSLRVTIEHTGWLSADETESGKVEGHVEREDDIATVAFWYQVGQPKRFTKLPSAKERVFPNLDLIIEGRTLRETARHSPGSLRLQEGYDWTGAGQLFFVPAPEPEEPDRAGRTAVGRDEDAPGAASATTKPAREWLEFDFRVEKQELRRLVLRLTHSYDYPVVRVLLDGKPAIERLDLYSKDIEVHDHSLGDHCLAVGPHTIRIEVLGQNASSGGRRMGVDSVRLRERWQKKRPALKP